MSLTKVIIASQISSLHWVHTPHPTDEDKNICNVYKYTPETGWYIWESRTEFGSLEELSKDNYKGWGFDLLNTY